MNKYIPDRKILLGGASGVVAWAILAALQHYGINPQPIVDSIFAAIGSPAPAAQPALAGLIAWAVAYGLPQADKDILKRIDQRIIRIAGLLPGPAMSPVTPVPQPAAQPSAGPPAPPATP